MSRFAIAYFQSPAEPVSTDLHATLAAFIRERGWVLLEPFVEAPAATRRRPQLELALARCTEAGAVLVVPDLAAVAEFGFLERVLDAGVKVAAPGRGAVGRRTLALLHDVASESRRVKSRRTRDALARARRRGVRLGSPRPEVGARHAAAAQRRLAHERSTALAPLVEELRLSNPGASLRALGQLLEAEGVPGPRGGHWGPSAVRNLLRRIDGDEQERPASPPAQPSRPRARSRAPMRAR
jgi:hypothetical protein